MAHHPLQPSQVCLGVRQLLSSCDNEARGLNQLPVQGLGGGEIVGRELLGEEAGRAISEAFSSFLKRRAHQAEQVGTMAAGDRHE